MMIDNNNRLFISTSPQNKIDNLGTCIYKYGNVSFIRLRQNTLQLAAGSFIYKFKMT
jgi:hypothetical protein